jgi:FkbM family methyltransferase
VSALSSVAGILPDTLFVRAIAHAHKRFEPEMSPIVAACPRYGTAVDVGAWYGPWTYWLSRRVERVVAFEPNPGVADVLERTVRSNVRIVRAAASADVGTATLTLPAGGKGTEGRASLEGLEDSDRTVSVPTMRVDDLDVDDVVFVKIDVEGHECTALRGAEKLLDRWHPVLAVEIEERHGGIAPTVDLLAGWGYRGKVLLDREWRWLDDFDLAAHQEQFLSEQQSGGYLRIAARRQQHYVNNVVFVHPETTWDVT